MSKTKFLPSSGLVLVSTDKNEQIRELLFIFFT